MAHKNVSFFIPKTMMTTGEKMKENSHPILTLISRTFWCVEAGKRCQLCSKSATARNYSVRSRQQLLTRAKLTLTPRYIDELWNWAHSEKLYFMSHNCYRHFISSCLQKKGSHQCRGAFFTDSNELDPAVMTERSKEENNSLSWWFL